MHQKKHPLVKQIDEIYSRPEMHRFHAAFTPWFVRDMQTAPLIYQPVVQQIAERHPVVLMLYPYIQRGKPMPFLPNQAVFDELMNALIDTAKKRMPAKLITLERAAAGVIPNARRN